MTRDYYVSLRQKGQFTEEFIYKAYADTEKNVVSGEQFFTIIQLMLVKSGRNLNQLVSHLISYYDNKFKIKMVMQDDKILKVY
jgi:hypothetical protein